MPRNSIDYGFKPKKIPKLLDLLTKIHNTNSKRGLEDVIETNTDGDIKEVSEYIHINGEKEVKENYINALNKKTKEKIDNSRNKNSINGLTYENLGTLMGTYGLREDAQLPITEEILKSNEAMRNIQSREEPISEETKKYLVDTYTKVGAGINENIIKVGIENGGKDSRQRLMMLVGLRNAAVKEAFKGELGSNDEYKQKVYKYIKNNSSQKPVDTDGTL